MPDSRTIASINSRGLRSFASARSSSSMKENFCRAAKRPPAQSRGRAVVRRLGEGQPVFGGVDAELRLRRFTDAALGLVDHAPGRRLVTGVHDEPRERERVLDLLAVVEAHAPR